MTEQGEYVIDHTYFLNHSDIKTRRYHAQTEEEAIEKMKMLSELGNTSQILISKRGFKNRLNKIRKWTPPN